MTETEGAELSWDVRPWRSEPVKGVLVILLILLVSFVVLALGGAVLGALATVILAANVGPFYATTHYRLTPDEVEVRSPFQRLRKPWSVFQRVSVGERGVSLSPYAKRHFLEPYRNVVLRFGEDAGAVKEWVQRYGPGTDVG